MSHGRIVLWTACFLWLSCAALGCIAFSQNAQELPKIEGETFAGRRITLPDAAYGKVTVFILGFTKASKTATGAWSAKISKDFKDQAGFELYQLPVLEDVPRLFRGMVVSGIKKGTPEADRDHFVPVLQGEAELKKAVNYNQADDAYVVVLDRAGKMVEQLHGPDNDSQYGALREKIRSLLNQK